MKLEKLSALQIGDMVKHKVVSPTEVIDYFIDRINSCNPKLNAFTYIKEDYAREAAKQLEDRIMSKGKIGPLAGVPFALKDFLPSKEGWSASHGGVEHFQTMDKVTGVVCRAAESLDAIAIGKTNAPSFGFRGTTDNKMYGPTGNPFNPAYNSGGSSGGSASAVGGLLVPLAECGDAGGSTRIPSAWCGCFGFKPSAGTVPSICRPDAWTATHPYCCPGPAARTVDDAAIILDKMMVYNPRDPLSVPCANRSLANAKDSFVKGMKIAVTYDYNLFEGVDPQIKAAVDQTANVLAAAGAEVEYVKFNFKFSLEDMLNAWFLGISIDDSLDPRVASLIENHPEDLPEAFIRWQKQAKNATMQDYRKFHDIRTSILDSNLDILSDHDIILSPISSCMPVLNSSTDTVGPKEIEGHECEQLIGFTQTWLQNMTGNPAAAVPVCLGENNLPIGIQLVGRRYFDEDIFKVAYELERIQPWIEIYNEVAV